MVEEVKPPQNRRRQLLKKLLLLAVSLGVAVLLMEVVCRALKLAPQVGPTFTTYSSLLDFENKKNLNCVRTTAEYKTRVSTNHLGLRNPPLEVEKPADTQRVLCIGDSFTFGKGVEDDETFSRKLEAKLNASGDQVYQVLNAGVVSYGTANEYIFLKERGLAYRPDTIVLQIGANDFGDNANTTLFTLDDQQQLVPGQADPRLKKMVRTFNAIPLRSILEYSHLFNYMRLRLNFTIRTNRLRMGKHGETDAAAIKTRLLLRRLLAVADENGIPVLIFVCDMPDDKFEIIREIADECSIRTVNFGPLRQERPDLYYVKDRHWNPKGHTYVAEKLLEELRSLEDSRADVTWLRLPAAVGSISRGCGFQPQLPVSCLAAAGGRSH